MNGYGIFFWKDGRVFKGNYKEDKKNEFGIYLKPEGKKYEGYWKNGSQSSLGRYRKKDGTVKLGIWNDNNIIEQYTPNTEFYNMKNVEIDGNIKETNIKIDEIINQMRAIFIIYLPNTDLDDFIKLEDK